MIEDKIKKAMSGVFGISVDTINDASSPDNIEKWDSLNQMNFVVALEETFDIELTDDEISQMLNFKLIKVIISEKLGK